jgi:hypothetical protein
VRPPWEKEPFTGRQRILTELANATAYIVRLEKLFADGEGPAKIRGDVAEALAKGLDPVETRGLLEWAELIEAVAEYRALYRKLYGNRGGGLTGKSKVGRPSIWRGPKGWYFFAMVTKACKTKSRSIATAIRWVVKNDPWLKDLGDDITALQIRYQEAAAHWGWVLNDEHGAMQLELEARFERVNKALDAWESFHLRERGLSVRQSDFP